MAGLSLPRGTSVSNSVVSERTRQDAEVVVTLTLAHMATSFWLLSLQREKNSCHEQKQSRAGSCLILFSFFRLLFVSRTFHSTSQARLVRGQQHSTLLAACNALTLFVLCLFLFFLFFFNPVFTSRHLLFCPGLSRSCPM